MIGRKYPLWILLALPPRRRTRLIETLPSRWIPFTQEIQGESSFWPPSRRGG